MLYKNLFIYFTAVEETALGNVSTETVKFLEHLGQPLEGSIVVYGTNYEVQYHNNRELQVCYLFFFTLECQTKSFNYSF
jgi:hypothetical protein